MKEYTLTEDDLIQLILSMCFFFLLLAFIIIIITLAYGKRKQNHMLEVALIKSEFSQTLLTTQNEIQEQTLRTISQELHDNISQKLGLAKLQLNLLQSGESSINISDTKTVIMDALADIRALSKSLHPDRIASIPLKESMEHEIYLLTNATSVNFHCVIEADGDVLSNEQRIILFRIFQELLNNALKYAGATKVDIIFTIEPSITLTIADNGVGLPIDYQKGIGHTSIQNRVKLLKGNFVLESSAKDGTRAKVEIPKG